MCGLGFRAHVVFKRLGVLGFGMLWNLGPLGLEGFCGVGGDRRARLGPTVQVA